MFQEAVKKYDDTEEPHNRAESGLMSSSVKIFFNVDSTNFNLFIYISDKPLSQIASRYALKLAANINIKSVLQVNATFSVFNFSFIS